MPANPLPPPSLENCSKTVNDEHRIGRLQENFDLGPFYLGFVLLSDLNQLIK